MTILQDVTIQFEGFAADLGSTVLADIKAFAAKEAPGLEKTAEAVEQEAETLVADGKVAFTNLVSQVGQLATARVAALLGSAGAGLSGLEKANLAGTQLVEDAANKGITIAANDVSTIIKNAFLAVTDTLSTVL